MNVASPELSVELFKHSGWLDPDYEPRRWTPSSPYYSLGYLIRKLPERCKVGHSIDEGQYYALGFNINCRCDTPEDAAVRLAIELFKQGILKREPES